jgi:tetratricopeptide (TPR) repeat protein
VGGGLSVDTFRAFCSHKTTIERRESIFSMDNLLKRSLAILEKALGPDHPDVAMSLNNLAALHEAQGQYAQAEPLLKRSLAIREKAIGPDHPDVAVSLNNLGELYRAQGRYAQAEPLYKRSLAIWEKVKLKPRVPRNKISVEVD